MSEWEFWIDVGGTFTDSFARAPDGTLRHAKVLSSGVFKGAVGPPSERRRIVDTARHHDPENIWAGYRFRLLDEQGATLCETTVARFDAAASALELSAALACDPRPGQPYELSCDAEAPVVAIRYLLGTPLANPLPHRGKQLD